LDFRPYYRGLTADFIRWLIVEGRLAGFKANVERHRKKFFSDVSGRPNDARIAGNFALLAASFEEFALYMADAWPDSEDQARCYIEDDLMALRDRVLGIAQEQQSSEIFLETLRTLLAHNKVRFDHDNKASIESYSGEVIGKATSEFYEVSIPMAMAAVQGHLRRQGRDELKVSQSNLIQQLEAAEKIVPPPTKAGAEGEKTRPLYLQGKKVRCVRVKRTELEGEG
jgi:hypothetical protein